MTVTRIRLWEGSRELILGGREHTRSDMLIHSINPGSPTVREVTESRTDTDGEYDTTRNHGGRAVAMTATIFTQTLLDELNSYLHPRRRPNLGVLDDALGPERFLALRRDSFDPGEIDNLSHIRRKLQFQWKCATGLWQATDPVSFELLAEADHTVGRVYPLIFPRVYPAAPGTGQTIHVNPGSTWSDQMVRMYGPCNGPRYSNDDTGETIAFTEDLVLPAGDYIEVDTANHTVYYLSDPAASRLGFLDLSISSWWQLPPGPTKVRYHPTSGVDPGCGSVTTYQPSWL